MPKIVPRSFALAFALAFVSTSDAQALFTPSALVGSSSTANVGVGISDPAYSLHSSGDIGVAGNRQFVARYSNSQEDYRATFGWSHLQLGNNGLNWIVAGRTQTGGSLTFVVNNTNDYAYNSFNGIQAMHITSGGYVGIGTTAPGAKLTVKATDGTTGGIRLQHSSDHGPLVNIYQTASDGAIDLYTGENPTILRTHISSYGHTFFNPNAGNVGIGTTTPSHKLAVNGTVRAKEVIVDTGWADYVFADDYELKPLAEVEAHIEEKKHLPGIPSAAEVAEQGVSLGEMQSKLLAKIEELTLHVIAQEKRMQAQEVGLLQQQQQIEAQRVRILSLQAELNQTSNR